MAQELENLFGLDDCSDHEESHGGTVGSIDPPNAAQLEGLFGLDVMEQDAGHLVDGDPLEDLFGFNESLETLEEYFDIDAQEPVEHGRRKLPVGLQRHGSAFGRLMSAIRWSGSGRDDSTSRDYGALANAWNLVTLRTGDKAAITHERRPLETHPNTYDLKSLTKLVFKDIGKGVRKACSSGVEQSSCMLMNMASIGSLAGGAFLRGSRKIFRMFMESVANTEAVVFCRSSDATPMLLQFGKLREELAPMSRFLKYIEPEDENHYGRWTTISYEQYLKENPGRMIQPNGVLEVFACSSQVHWGGFKETGEISGTVRSSFWRNRHDFLNGPRILMRGNSSCVYDCLEGISDSFDSDGIIKLSKRLDDRGGVVIPFDMLDNCKVNKRVQRAMATKYMPYTNILYPANAGCECHALHNIITAELRESKVVGHGHAFVSVVKVNGRAQQLLQAGRQIISRELVCLAGEPPPEYKVQLETCIENTFMRQARLVRGCISADPCDADIQFCKSLEVSLPAFRKMCNGNLCIGKCSHYCQGCCVDEHGVTQRDIQVTNFFSAVVAVGLFGGLNSSTPATSRWLSTAIVLALVLAGCTVFGLLPRAWRLAFGEWTIPRGVPDNDFHRMIRSKCYRVSLWFQSDEMQSMLITFVVASSPAEHLLQRIQWLDARGAILRDLVGASTTPFRSAMLMYAKLMTSPLDTGARLLFQHSQAKGCEVVDIAFQVFFITCLSMASRIWLQKAKLAGWPFRLVGLVMPDKALRIETAKALAETKQCCLDASMTAKAVKLAERLPGGGPFWKKILRTRGLLAALTIFSWVYKLSNMHLERLLSLIRKSSPVRPLVERLLHSGFLTQVLQRHLQAGGNDIRVIKREALLKSQVPIHARRQRLRRSADRQMRYAKWMNNRVKAEKKRRTGWTRAEYLAFVQSLKKEFSENSDILELDEQGAEEGAEEGATGQTYADRIQTSLSCCSSEDTPLDPTILQEEIDMRVPSKATSKRGCGLTFALHPVREEYRKSLICKDCNTLPLSETYSLPKCCGELHPDVCRSEFSKDLDDVVKRSQVLFKKISRLSFVCIRVSRVGGAVDDYYKCVAYQDPLLFVRCVIEDGRPVFSKDSSGEFSFETGERAVASIGKSFATVRINKS